MEALSFALWWFLIQTQGANRAEGGNTWLEMRTPIFLLPDSKPRVYPPIHLPWRKEMQSGLFYRQQMMLLPTRRNPILTWWEITSFLLFSCLVFGQLFLLTVPSELIQRYYFKDLDFLESLSFKRNKETWTLLCLLSSFRQASRQACYWAGRLWQVEPSFKTVPSPMLKTRCAPPPPPRHRGPIPPAFFLLLPCPRCCSNSRSFQTNCLWGFLFLLQIFSFKPLGFANLSVVFM